MQRVRKTPGRHIGVKKIVYAGKIAHFTDYISGTPYKEVFLQYLIYNLNSLIAVGIR